MNSDRTDALRTLLITTVDAAPAVTRRPRGRLAAAAIAAFALAGAATGGAVSAAIASQGAPITDEMFQYTSTELAGFVIGPRTTAIGQPFTAGSDSTTFFALGPIPAGAESLGIGIRCIDPGTFTQWVDGEAVGWVTCDEGGQGTAGLLPVSAAATHTLRIEPDGNARYVVWASWATEQPYPDPSPAQAAALADGSVTREEYLAGFDRFAACMDAAGYSIGPVDHSPVVLHYSTSDAAFEAGVDTECYQAEFAEVDATWQVANEE